MKYIVFPLCIHKTERIIHKMSNCKTNIEKLSVNPTKKKKIYYTEWLT